MIAVALILGPTASLIALIAMAVVLFDRLQRVAGPALIVWAIPPTLSRQKSVGLGLTA